MTFRLPLNSASEERDALSRLDSALDSFFSGVKEIIHLHMHDKWRPEDINVVTNYEVKKFILGYVQRDMFEEIFHNDTPDSLNEKEVARLFDNGYYHVCARHIVPEGFRKIARPYDYRRHYDEI